MKRIRVLIVEDEPLMRGVYTNILNDIAKEKGQLPFDITSQSVFEDAKKAIDESIEENRKYDVAILDMRLPDKSGKITEYGKQLGETFRKLSPRTKLIIITSLSDNHVFYQISKNINPEGFMVKTEIGYDSLKVDILMILQNKIAYSKSIVGFLRNEAGNNLPLDDIDRKIIHCLSQGIPMKDIPDFVPLSLSGIERRKRRMVALLCLRDSSVKTLVEAAKRLGLI